MLLFHRLESRFISTSQSSFFFFSQWVGIAHLEAFIDKRQWGFEACLEDCSSICWIGSFVSDKTEILSVKKAGLKSSWAQEKAGKKIIETQLSDTTG